MMNVADMFFSYSRLGIVCIVRPILMVNTNKYIDIFICFV